MLALIIPLGEPGHLPILPPRIIYPGGPVDPGYGRPPWRPVDPGYGHPLPPVDPGFGVRPPVDPGYGRPP
jgi:hypothetical protein